MISILILSGILFFAAKLIHKDSSMVEFVSMLSLVITPVIVGFLVRMVVGALELPQFFDLLGIISSIIVVFFFSNAIFEWGYKKSAMLAGVYLVASIAVEIFLMTLMAG